MAPVCVAAAAKLVEAARMLAAEPIFEALRDIAGERSSTVVFPLPVDLLRQFPRQPEAGGGGASG